MNCKGCNLIRMCLTPVKKCPCTKCLVKMVCKVLCYERHIIGATHLKLKPIPEEEFKKLEKQWVDYV